MIELTMDYVTTHMMCMMLKHKEKKTQDDGCSYVLNYGEWHKPWKIFLPHILIALQIVH